MFYVIKSTRKVNANTLVYEVATPISVASFSNLAATFVLAPGYLGSRELKSADQMTITVIQRWLTLATYNAWALAQAAPIGVFNANKASYNLAVGISYGEIQLTSAVILF